MAKILLALYLLLGLWTILFVFPKNYSIANAQVISINPSLFAPTTPQNVKITISRLKADKEYTLITKRIARDGKKGAEANVFYNQKPDAAGKIVVQYFCGDTHVHNDCGSLTFTEGVWHLMLYEQSSEFLDPTDKYVGENLFIVRDPNSPPIVGEAGKGAAITNCPDGNEGIVTALGCIPVTNTSEFVTWTLRWILGIAGGIAFLLILVGGLKILTSGGNPDQLKGGKEQLTAAISGLLFLIFAVFLLKLIGLDILGLPGF
ncbi:hypothetical protein HY404_02550 [Candidatus Microgenomates bacterium]|nr:hypothetical protein [Candidatus Microgenomates bacterium]